LFKVFGDRSRRNIVVSFKRFADALEFGFDGCGNCDWMSTSSKLVREMKTDAARGTGDETVQGFITTFTQLSSFLLKIS
jgi:hypothetical protein